jgi:hypothetical protein
MALHLYFGILFPATDIRRHTCKLNVFFEENVHLSLDWVFLSSLDKRGSIVQSGHRIEILMGATVDAAAAEVRVKNIFAMSSIRNSIVNDELKHDIKGCFAMEREVFAVACYDFTILLQSFLYGCTV